MKILLAIPDTAVREPLIKLLRKRLSRDVLEVVSDGKALLDRARDVYPQIVVMDTLLPMMDGISVFYELRKLPVLHQPEVVLLSSLTSDYVIREAARLQPSFFVTLPCDIHRVAENILQCCRECMRIRLEPCTKLEWKVAHCLHRLGLSTRAKGYPYAREAVLRIYHDPGLAHALTKCLYPDIAKTFGTNPACVERAIRSAITTAWEKQGVLWQKALFLERPTNGEFFNVIAQFLLEQQEKEEAE